MRGVISRLKPSTTTPEGRRTGGYGFVRDPEERDRFFHANDVRGCRFDQLEEGQTVDFEPVVGGGKGNGLRAELVRLVD